MTASRVIVAIVLAAVAAACGNPGGPRYAALVITTTSLPNAVPTVPYSEMLSATGGDGIYTWSVSDGSLPTGLNLTASTGIISGTPSVEGQDTFTVEVASGDGQADTQQLAITVESGPEEPGPTHPLGNINATLTLEGRPHGVAVASSGIFYISRIDDDSVTRGQVDSLTQTFTGSVGVGHTPAHVALTPNGHTAFTANQFGNSVSVVDVATNRATAEIPLSDGGFNLLVSPDGHRLYVTTAAGVLHVIDVATLQVIDTVRVGAAANGLAIDADDHHVYVSSIFADRVSAVGAATNQIERVYAVAGMPQRIAINRAGDELYIASETAGLEVLDLASGTHTPVPGVGVGAVGLALSPDEQVLYVTRPPANELVIIDMGSRQVVKTLSGLARPRNVAFAASGRVALVTGEGGVVYFIR